MLNQNFLKSMYFYFIRCPLSYASTIPHKLKILNNEQKYAARIICNEDRLTHTKPLIEQLSILNIYQLKIVQRTTFMLKIKLNLTHNVFLNKFKQIKHKYPTTYAATNFVMPQKQLKLSKYSIITYKTTIKQKLQALQ